MQLAITAAFVRFHLLPQSDYWNYVEELPTFYKASKRAIDTVRQNPGEQC